MLSGLDAHIMLIDLDHFKHINDKYGHQVGDEVLVHFSEALKAMLDKDSYVFQWGGEEFAVLCYKTIEAVYICAEDIRITFETTDFGISATITVSIGLSNVIQLNFEENDYIIRADKALYQAKALGRNRTIMLIKK